MATRNSNYQSKLKKVQEKKEAPFPSDIKPMLATLVDEPFEEPGWLYEVKWDGFRVLAYIEKGQVDICSRNNKSFNDKFYSLFDYLKDLEINAVFDGEVVVLDKNGMPDFAALQGWRSEADGHLVYYVFDLLWIDGYDLMDTPFSERRKVLEAVLPQNGPVKISETLKVSGNEFFKVADKMKLEGIIAKREDSTYKPDKRTKDWLKIKTQRFQEAVIGGYTINEGTSRLFSSLLLGMFENGEFISVATVGTGFNKKQQQQLLDKLKPLHIKNCPFKEQPEYNKPSRFRPNPPKADVYWVKPEVVVEISFRTVAPDGAFRHPSYKGIREDKAAKEVVRELPDHTPDVVQSDNILLDENVLTKPGKLIRNTLLNPSEKTQVREIGGQEIKFTNVNKTYWPDMKVTKRDMINYYYQVVPYILPYLKDRPQTLHRYVNGIQNKSFYQKDVKGKVPEWLDTFDYFSKGDDRWKEFLIVSKEESLLYLAQLGCIEMNPWSSRAQTPDQPDWCIIDLDPVEHTFEQVIEVACVTKNILDEIGVKAYPKTSGSSGMHIYIPLKEGYTYEDSKEFGRKLAKAIHKEVPKFTTIERYKEKRDEKLYIDFLQNRPQATVAAPYSLRPKPGATISMPLHWDEVRKGLKIKDFHIKNGIGRIDESGDLFKGVLKGGIDIKEVEQRLERI